MASLKLYYLDGKCRAEVARLILAAAGKEYEDIRFTYEGWSKYKPLMPFGRCPGLEVDGKVYAQSLAINTFLAREFGFYADNNLDALKIDQTVQLVDELMNIAVNIDYMLDGEVKVKAAQTAKLEKGPKYLGHLEKLLEENGTSYFVGDKMTLADFVVFDMITGYLEPYVKVNESYPLLQKHTKTMLSHDKIGPYMASRPKRDF